MIDRCCTRILITVADRAVFVDLVLEQVRVDRSNADSIFPRELCNFGWALIFRKVPEYMYSYRRTKARECMDLSGVSQFILDINCSGILKKFSESRTGIGKSPAWCFNLEAIQGLVNFLNFGIGHKKGVYVSFGRKKIVRNRGPCAPSTRMRSISPVRLGPVMNVIKLG